MSHLAKRRIEDMPLTRMQCTLDALAAHPDQAVQLQVKQLRCDLDDFIDRAGRALDVSMSQTEAVIREHDKVLVTLDDFSPRFHKLTLHVASMTDEKRLTG